MDADRPNIELRYERTALAAFPSPCAHDSEALPGRNRPGRTVAVPSARADNEGMAVAITTVGAVLATLLGVLVGSVLSSRSQSEQWSRDRQADACAQILRESSNLLIEFTKPIWQHPAPAEDGANMPTPIDWRPWNEALTVIDLVADHAIVEAVLAMDAQIWRVHQQIKRGWVLGGEWPTVRELVEAPQRDFVNVARRRLAAKGPPLRHLTGRPPADDPIWEFRRPTSLAKDKTRAAPSNLLVARAKLSLKTLEPQLRFPGFHVPRD